MALTWNFEPPAGPEDTDGVRVSTDGRFRIVPLAGEAGYALFDSKAVRPDNPDGMICASGDIDDCFDTAGVICGERPPRQIGRGIVTARPLSPAAETVVVLTRRAFMAGERLLRLNDLSAPASVVEFNLNIIRRIANNLAEEANNLTAAGVPGPGGG